RGGLARRGAGGEVGGPAAELAAKRRGVARERLLLGVVGAQRRVERVDLLVREERGARCRLVREPRLRAAFSCGGGEIVRARGRGLVLRGGGGFLLVCGAQFGLRARARVVRGAFGGAQLLGARVQLGAQGGRIAVAGDRAHLRGELVALCGGFGVRRGGCLLRGSSRLDLAALPLAGRRGLVERA